MGIFKRIGDLARANLNQLIGELEDPKKLSEQIALDLAASKKKAEGLLVSVTAAMKMAEDKLKTLPEKVVMLADKAETFLRNSDENNAKEMLRQKQELELQIQGLEQEIAHSRETKDSLKQGLAALDDKISNLRSSSTINAGERAINKEDAFSTFARMEEKIEAKEFEIAAWNELVESVEKEQHRSEKIEFDKHSEPESIERELDEMRRKLKK